MMRRPQTAMCPKKRYFSRCADISAETQDAENRGVPLKIGMCVAQNALARACRSGSICTSMSVIEILWSINGLLLPFGIGAAIGMVSLSPPEFGIARWCLIVPAIVVGATAFLWLLTTDRPGWWRLIVGVSVGAIALAGLPESLRWVGNREKLAGLVSGAVIQLGPLIETIDKYQKELNARGQTDIVLQEILEKYDELQQTESLFEVMRGGCPNFEERLAIKTHVIEELRTIKNNTKQLQFRIAGAGHGALIIKTAPNTLNVTFSVPMRATPNLTFYNLPSGVKGWNLTATTPIGFTVAFEPSDIDIALESFQFTASADL
jgi:hypothetical protein